MAPPRAARWPRLWCHVVAVGACFTECAGLKAPKLASLCPPSGNSTHSCGDALAASTQSTHEHQHGSVCNRQIEETLESKIEYKSNPGMVPALADTHFAVCGYDSGSRGGAGLPSVWDVRSLVHCYGESVQVDASESCGCCNGANDNFCHGGGCACAEDSFPVQSVIDSVISRSPQRRLYTAVDAADLLRGRSILFVGDSAVRRTFLALCGFLKRKSFFDDRSHYCGQCRVDDSDILLEFWWAPTVANLASLPTRSSGKAAQKIVRNCRKHDSGIPMPRFDLSFLGLYFHDYMFNGLDGDQIVEAVATHLRQASDDEPPVVILTPNLVARSVDAAAGMNPLHLPPSWVMNKQVLDHVAALSHANLSLGDPDLRGKPSATVLDATTWMRESAGGLERHSCLGRQDWSSHGVHIDNHFGQVLRVQLVLAHMAKVLA